MSGRTDAGARGPRSLSHHIATLALLLLAPALTLGVLTSVDLAGRLRGVAEHALEAGAHAAALAVTREVEARWLLLKALAVQTETGPGGAGVARIEAAAAHVLEGQPAAAIRLAAAGVASRPDGIAPAIERTVGADGAAEFAVAVPLPGAEGSLATLTLPLPTQRLAEAMAGPGLPQGAFALLLDGAGRVVARAPAALAPDAAPAWLVAALAAGAPGPLRGPGEDQRPLVLYPQRLGLEGWTALVGQSEGAFTASWRAPALRHLAGGLLVAALGLGLASWFAGRLQRALPVVGPTEAGTRAGPRVAEFETLGRTVRAAQDALREEAAHAARVAAENRRLAEEAANDRQLLLSIMESAPDPIFVKDAALRYVVVNEAAAGLIGLRPQDAVGRGDADLFDAREAEEFAAQDRLVLQSGATAEFARALVMPGTGERRLLRTVKAPWRTASGEIVGVVGIARDVTRREEAERRLREAEDAMRRIARADTLTVMSLGVAHELNQPLTAASNFLRASLRWLERAPEDPARLDAARAAITEASAETLRAAEILRRLRDFIGRGETEQTVVPLAALLADTAGLIRAARRSDDLDIALDLPREACGVLGDRFQLQQVFVNLLRNAVEATEGVAERGLAVTLRVAGGEAVVTVADRGPGLPPEVTERLFEPFVSTRPDGMGIGLSISRAIVEAHGGRIAARPRPGGGTEFVIELPLREG